VHACLSQSAFAHSMAEETTAATETLHPRTLMTA